MKKKVPKKNILNSQPISITVRTALNNKIDRNDINVKSSESNSAPTIHAEFSVSN